MVFVKGQVTNPAGAKLGNKNAKGGKSNLKHGYYSLVKIIRNRRGALDRRTILGKMVLETARQLEADLGGDLSTAEKMLVADVALDTLLLQALNNEIGNSPPLIAGKNGLQAHPVYTLRAQLIAQRREHLKLLGLKRVARVLGIDAIKERYKNGDDGEQPANGAEQANGTD
jgi:hypothetical protein